MKGLEPETEYYITLHVYDEQDNVSAYENLKWTKDKTYTMESALAKTTPDYEPPYLSDHKMKIDKTTTSIKVMCSPAVDNCPGDIEYSIYCFGKDCDYSYKTQGGSVNIAHVFKDLQPNTQYRVIAYATDKAGNHSVYNQEYITTDKLPNQKPTLSDDEIKIVSVTENSVAIAWATATDDYTPKNKLRYRVQWIDGDTWKYADFVNKDSYVIEDLTPDHQYTICVMVSDEADEFTSYKSKVVRTSKPAIEVKKYPVYILGEQVTSTNAADVWEDGGSISYNASTKTLTLAYVEMPKAMYDGDYLALYEGVNIKLIGSNEIHGPIYADNSEKVTIKGTGSLLVEAKNPYVGHGTLALEGGCSVTVKGVDDSYGLSLGDGKLIVNASTLKASGSGSPKASIYGCSGLELTDCGFISDHQYKSGTFVDGSDNVATDEIVIGPGAEDKAAPAMSDENIEIKSVTHNSVELAWEKAHDNVSKQENLTYTVYIKKDSEGSYGESAKAGKDYNTCTIEGLEPETYYDVLILVSDEKNNVAAYAENRFLTSIDPSFKIYDLFVQDIQVTSKNADDILSDGGSVKYDKDANTLTLKDAIISGKGIYAVKSADDILFNIEGNNMITSDYGIAVKGTGATMFSGTGTLIVMSSYPVTTKGDLVVQDGCHLQLDATGEFTSALTLSDKSIYVIGSDFRALGDIDKPSIVGCNYLSMTNCQFVSKHIFNASTGKFYDTNGQEATDEIVIAYVAPTPVMDCNPPMPDESVLNVSDITDNSVSLEWGAAYDDVTKEWDIRYYIYVDGVVQTSALGIINYTVTGLEPNRYYTFEVHAMDEAGNTYYYPAASAVTLKAPDTMSPVLANSTVLVGDVTDKSVNVVWEAAHDEETEAGNLKYKVVWSVSGVEVGSVELTGETSCTITGLVPEAEYDVLVTVTDEAGNSANYTPASVTTFATGIADVTLSPSSPRKYYDGNRIVIRRNGKFYDADGRMIK